ncbi:MAG: hypothetical protein ACOYO1_03030 [Bacteroidales bacterium]
MKKNIYKTGMLSFFLISVITLLFLYFKIKISSLFGIIVFGLFAGIFIVLLNAYFIPGKTLHKIRFLLYGLLYGIALFIFNYLNHFSEEENIRTIGLGVSFSISICIGFLLGSVFLTWNYRVIKNQTPISLMPEEFIILEDSAYIYNEDSMGKGRLVLSNKRLVFIFLDKEISNFEVYFSIKISVELSSNKFDIPNGIILSEKESEIRVKFPKLWLKEIREMIINNL